MAGELTETGFSPPQAFGIYPQQSVMVFLSGDFALQDGDERCPVSLGYGRRVRCLRQLVR